MTSTTFTATSDRQVELFDAPIYPAWIRSGAPRARMAEVSRSRDGTAVCVIWDCTAGQFEWRFAVDETVHIIEGEVHVSDKGGERSLGPGDIGFFPAGSVSIWRVDAYVRKLAVCRHSMPASLGLVLRAVTKLKSLITGV